MSNNIFKSMKATSSDNRKFQTIFKRLSNSISVLFVKFRFECAKIPKNNKTKVKENKNCLHWKVDTMILTKIIIKLIATKLIIIKLIAIKLLCATNSVIIFVGHFKLSISESNSMKLYCPAVST